MSVDAFLAKTWSPTYDCRAFARDVWMAETGQNLELTPHDRRRFARLERPRSPCLVLMKTKDDLHVGVFVRGRVLHLTRLGARHDLLENVALGCEEVKFYG